MEENQPSALSIQPSAKPKLADALRFYLCRPQT
jgi:hypothetical protein